MGINNISGGTNTVSNRMRETGGEIPVLVFYPGGKIRTYRNIIREMQSCKHQLHDVLYSREMLI